jgi:hypothetical protein
MTETPRKNVEMKRLINSRVNPVKYKETGTLVDPTKYSSLRDFKAKCGCLGCSRLDNSDGTWRSAEDLSHHIGLQDSMTRAYHSKTPHPAFYCEIYTRKTSTLDLR